MAWTTPLTWTAGMALGATDFNTHIRDNLNNLKSPSFGRTACNPTAVPNIKTTGTTWTAITAGISLTLTTYGGALHCGFQGINNAGEFLAAFAVDDVVYTGIHPSGIAKVPSGLFSIEDWIVDITASGSHTIRPAWRVPAGTVTANISCSGQPAIFWVREG